MASISSVGIGSGVLTSELIDDLVAVEREAGDKRIAAEQEDLDTQVSELGTLASLAENFRSTASALNLSSSFESNTTSSSNDSAVSATASSIASPGVYTIETTQLARAQTIASGVYAELDDVIGNGELEFNFGDVDYDIGTPSFSFTADSEAPARKISIDASNNTLSGVRDAVNNANMGVQATIVDTGSGYRLLFQAENSGEKNGFTLTVNNPTNGLESLNFDDAATTMLETVAGQDANLKVNGLEITRDSNLVTGVINGLTLNLKQEDAGPVTLTVAIDTSAVTTRVSDFIGAYNEMKLTINSLTAFDPDAGRGSVFTGDSTIRKLVSASQSILGSFMSSLEGGDFRTLSEVGIKTNSKTGELIFSASDFETALQSNAEGLTTLFGVTGNATDPLINYVSSTNDTQAGDHEIIITRLAEQAQYIGLSTSGEPFVIDDGNDAFKVDIDGVKSNQITLDKGTYTGDELAVLLQNTINTDTKIDGGGKSIDVSYNATENRFEMISASYGSQSAIGFESTDKSTAVTLGLREPAEGSHSGATVGSLKSSDALAAALTINGGNDDFKLEVNGVVSNGIKIANGSYPDGGSLADALEDAINDDSNLKAANIVASVTYTGDLNNGKFELSFEQNDDGKPHGFVVLEAESAMSASLGIDIGAGKFAEVASLAATDTLATTLNDTAEFKIQANGVWSDTLSVAINSNDGSDIAAALEAAIMADANFIGAAEGAQTSFGSLDLTVGAIDFTTTPKAVGLEYNGTRYDLLVNANGVAGSDLDGDGDTDFVDDILQSVQDQIDLTPGLAGNVTANRSGLGLVFQTVAAGPGETLNAVADGSGAVTSLGATAVVGTEDFTANVTTFTLDVGGEEFNITLDGDASAGDTVNEVQSYIQGKLDAALDANINFSAGDITVELDGSNNLYFQTNSKNSVSTSDTVGSGATLEVKNLVDPLSLFPADSVYSSGHDGSGALDGFGIASGLVRGEDLTQVSVTYDGSTDGGSFKIDFGNDVDFHVQTPNAFAETSLGLAETNNSDFIYDYGVNVSGSIGGFAAIGSGQSLVGSVGSAVEDLRINVLGGNLGTRGGIDFSRGIAARLEEFLDNFLGSDGGFGVKQSGLQTELEELALERTELDDRIEKFQARLASQFSYNDTLISQLNTTQDFLSQQFEILSAIYKKD